MTKKTATQSDPNQLTEAYVDYLLTEGQRPNSVYHFAKIIKIDEQDFYQHFNSLPGLEKALWASFLYGTMEKIKEDKVYQEYGIREKLLAIFYTFVEGLKTHRSYILFCLDKRQCMQAPFYYEKIKKDFRSYAKELVTQGMETGEIKDRKMINDGYDLILWANFQYCIEFWAKDDSADYEQTDVAIEKAITASMDILGNTFLDSIFDFVKFSFQNR